MSENKRNFLLNLLMEAEAYRNIEDIEKLVDRGSDLVAIPIQPLYLALRSTSLENIALILPKLSPTQRKALLDIDIWDKDNLDLDSFELWPEVYSKCANHDIIKEFAKSEEFMLYLKTKFNIYAFDAEDPQYPNHDNFFITDDNQFLLEFDNNFAQVREVQYLIKMLYGDLGVDAASFQLMQLINDSYFYFQEELYQKKISRLRDFGFVDYYDALIFRASFSNLKLIDKFIKSKTKITGSLNQTSKNQSLHSSSLVSFKKGLDDIHAELAQLSDEKRIDFLQFNFVRLVNGTVALDGALKNGSVTMTKTGQKTKQKILLGTSYIKSMNSKINVFEYFDFNDVYKIGHSLLNIQKIYIKRALEKTPFDKDEYEFFLGAHWSQFLQNSFEEVVRTFSSDSEKYEDLIKADDYFAWSKRSKLFVELLPHVNSFFENLQNLIKSGQVNDQFYLNYTVENIDFEAILMSSFINFKLGNFEKHNVNKMGLTTNELKEFVHSKFLICIVFLRKKNWDMKCQTKKIKKFKRKFCHFARSLA